MLAYLRERENSVASFYCFCACEKTRFSAKANQSWLKFPRESRPGVGTEYVPVWKPEPLLSKRTRKKTVWISCDHKVAL